MRNEALVRADLNVIKSLEADDLMFTDASGMVSHKLDEIQSLKSGDVKFESITMTDTRVQDFGGAAVVTGSLVEKAQYKNADISGTYRFTDVWAKRNGKWKHVAGQETLLNMTAPPFTSAQSDAAEVKARLATLINSSISS
jgi:ketosteroid isomerase-like protein